MIVTRRGRRTAPSYVGKVLNPILRTEQVPGEMDEKLFRMLGKRMKPTGKLSQMNGYYQKLYENLTEAQQKNLIDKIANQILYAHSSVVARTLSDLALLSVDFSQKTEVAFRRLLLEKSSNRET